MTIARPSLHQQLDDSTSIFKFDAPELQKQLLQPPLAGSSLYKRHKKLASMLTKLTVPMKSHPADPLWEMHKALCAVLGDGKADTINSLADRTNPHDPLLATREALMMVKTAIQPVDVRTVSEDPGAHFREAMREYFLPNPSVTYEVRDHRIGYRWDLRLYKAAVDMLAPLAESLATTDIRQVVIYRCRGMILSYLKDFSKEISGARDNEDLNIFLDYGDPGRFKYSYLRRAD